MESLATVERAVDVLFHLHAHEEPCGVSSIGRALGMSKSTTHRLLTALTSRGLVERDERGTYRPGMGLVALGLGALEREPVVAAARPVLEQEAAQLGETVFLVAARASALVVLDKAEGTGFMRAAPRVGSSVPVHATAVGKLFLAFGPEQLGFPEGQLESFTEYTVGDSAGLQAEVDRARERGYAENREEWISGLAVLAAPVLVRGRMQAALAVAAPTARMQQLGREAVAARVLEAGRRAGARMQGGRS